MVYDLDLEPWECVRPASLERAADHEVADAKVTDVSERDAMTSMKTLAYHFLSLSHLTRLEIALQMGLLQEEDEGLLDADLLDRIVERATARGELSELCTVVEDRHKRERGTGDS